MEHAHILAALIEEKRLELDATSDARMWAEAQKTFSDVQEAINSKNPTKLKSSLQKLEEVLNNGKGREATEKELRELIKEHAKIAGNPVPPGLSEIIEQVLAHLEAAINEEVRDAEVRAKIADRLRRHVPEGVGGQNRR